MQGLKTLHDIDVKGQTALVRVDFNVPLNAEFQVTDNTRLVAAKETIDYLNQQGAKVVLMSHLGRPKSKEPEFSLQHIVPDLEKVLGKKVLFIKDCIGENVQNTIANAEQQQIILLENLRYYPEETTGDKAFSQQLAHNGTCYVNDAFGTAHRAHASTAIIAEFFDKKCLGMLMQKEIDSLKKVVDHPTAPVTAIIGGAKVSSKIEVIENLLPKTDNMIIGGGMAFTFIKALGGSIGNSLVEEDYIDKALEILSKAKQQNTQIVLPEDVVVADDFSAAANTKTTDINTIEAGWMGLDIGPKSQALMGKVILASKTILWNGPVGVFELEPFAKGTIAISNYIAEAT
ncbi:MAG: phosphoglycerate kinase, partial [Flavobacteriaceae bacterium]|nr:phosphoglycerate kinase [Flavobacteriaceae bacterium]